MIEIRSRLQTIEKTENKPRRTCPLLKVRARTYIARTCVIKIAARPKLTNPSTMPPATAANPVALELDIPLNAFANIGIMNRRNGTQVSSTPLRKVLAALSF